MSNTVVVTEVDQQVVEVQTPGPQGASGVTSLSFNGTGTLSLVHAGGTLTAIPSGLALTADSSITTAAGATLTLGSSDTTVATGERIGRIQFQSNDASTGGTGVRAFIDTYAEDSGTNYALTLGTGAGATATERVRIDSAGNVGVGTSSPTRQVAVYNATTPVLALQNSTTGQTSGDGLQLYVTGATAYIDQKENGSINFHANGAERMRIEATGQLLLGTGTSRSVASAARTLQVENAAQTSVSITRNSANVSGPNLAFGKSRGAATGSSTTVVANDELGTIHFAGADGTNLDSIGANIQAYVDGAVSTGVVPGRLVLSTADSAGAMQERMRLDSAGNVGIGKTATSKLDVNGTVTATAFAGPLTGNVSGNVTGNLTGATTGAHNGTVGATTPSTGAFTTINASSTVTAAGFSGPLTGNVTGNVTGATTGAHNGTVGATTPSTGAFTDLSYSGTLTGGTGVINFGSGQFYKNANGDIGISQTPSAWGSGFNALQTKGGALYSSVSGNVVLGQNFYSDGTNSKYITGNPATYYAQSGGVHQWAVAVSGTAGNNITFTEAMRVDVAGGFYVGTTSHTPNPGFSVQPAGTINIGNASSPSGSAFAMFYRAGGAIGSITQSGTTAVAFNTTSDERLKKNVVAAPSAGAVVDQIRVVSYDWKSDDSHVDYGVVAQELHEVYPDAVTPGDDTKPWAWDASFLVPLLVKELQELRARVAALEAAA